MSRNLEKLIYGKSEVPEFIKPSGKGRAISGWVAELVLTGLTNNNKFRECWDCPPPEGHPELKHLACACKAGFAVKQLAKSGWSEDDSESLIFDTDTYIGVSWLKFHPDGRTKFHQWFKDDTEEVAYENRRKAQKNEDRAFSRKVEQAANPLSEEQKAEKKRKQDEADAAYIYRYKKWQQILGYLEAHPKTSRHKTQKGLEVLKFSHYDTDQYIKKGIELGYINQHFPNGEGRGKKSELTCIGWPEAPVMKRPSIWNQTKPGQLFRKLSQGHPTLKSLTDDDWVSKVYDGSMIQELIKYYGLDNTDLQVVLKNHYPELLVPESDETEVEHPMTKETDLEAILTGIDGSGSSQEATDEPVTNLEDESARVDADVSAEALQDLLASIAYEQGVEDGKEEYIMEQVAKLEEELKEL